VTDTYPIPLYQWQNIKQLEAVAATPEDWEHIAARYDSSHNHGQARTCRLLAKSIRRGDLWRATVKRMTREAGLPEDIGVCPALERIWRQAREEVDITNPNPFEEFHGVHSYITHP